MKYVWEVKLVCTQTDDVYHEGQHPPEQRWGCAACPKAFSPSACCSHLALLYPDPHKHTCYVYRTPILPFLRRDNIQMNTIQVIISKIPQKVVAKKMKHTVIMMQGASFVQKSSSSSLWNVASFSTIMTNFAEDTISVHYQGKHKPSIQEWQKGEGCAYNTQSNSRITKDTSNPTNVWRNCNSLKENTVIKIGSTSKRCQSLKCIPCCYKHCCTIVVR